jgi:Protein of unknown function (DUF4235)
MAGLLFAPIGIGAGLVAGMLSKKVFDLVWSRVSDEEAPRPDQREVALAALVGALVVEGAIFRLAKGMTDRATRKGFARVTGSWPGEERPEPT